MTDHETLSHYTRVFSERSDAWRNSIEKEAEKIREYAQAEQDFRIENLQVLEDKRMSVAVYNEKMKTYLFDYKNELELTREVRRLSTNELKVAEQNLLTYKKLMSIT
ncbi:MAG: hypothetical protein DRJ69_06860 [Thermoprotei archaeon]|nr:MAG: hypothetical protein DRJ69_06860 [Thermoprotei archaeon]